MHTEKSYDGNNCLRLTEQLCALGGLRLAFAANKERDSIDFLRGERTEFDTLVAHAGSLIGRNACANRVIELL